MGEATGPVQFTTPSRGPDVEPSSAAGLEQKAHGARCLLPQPENMTSHSNTTQGVGHICLASRSNSTQDSAAACFLGIRIRLLNLAALQ